MKYRQRNYLQVLKKPLKKHLKINHEFICDFYHNRSEGLSACLIQAARMVMLRRHMEGLINTPKEKEIQAGDILFG